MPQASDELRREIERRFGSLDTNGPETYLKERGWSLSPEYKWSKPGIKDYGQMPRDEWDCFLFLRHEWDYGVLIPSE